MPARWRDRARASIAENRKAWTIGGIASAVALLFPIFTAGWPWVERAASFFESKTAAQAEYDKIRAELKINAVRDAWQNVGIARAEERTLRYIFRKECAGPKPSGSTDFCAERKTEHEQAAARLKEARDEAQKASR